MSGQKLNAWIVIPVLRWFCQPASEPPEIQDSLLCELVRSESGTGTKNKQQTMNKNERANESRPQSTALSRPPRNDATRVPLSSPPHLRSPIPNRGRERLRIWADGQSVPFGSCSNSSAIPHTIRLGLGRTGSSGSIAQTSIRSPFDIPTSGMKRDRRMGKIEEDLESVRG
jgi:hypothetical protein